MLEKRCPGLGDDPGGVIVTLREGECIEFVEADAVTEIGCGIGQRMQLLVGRHHVFVGIALALWSLFVGDGDGEVARPVEVQIGREHVGSEVMYAVCPVGGDV